MPRSRQDKPLSCAECRRLKVRCDLAFPCSHCVKRGLARLCPSGELVQGVNGQRVLAGTEELHARIAALESALREARGKEKANSFESPSVSPVTAANHVTAAEAGPSSYHAGHSRSEANGIGEYGTEGITDRPSSYSHLVIEEDAERTRYFGAASSVYLTQGRNGRFSERPLEPQLFSLPLPGGHALSSGSNVSVSEIVQRYVPQQGIAVELANLYYMTFGWFTNIVPQRQWSTKFLDHVYHPVFTPSPQRLTVFFLVLALGSVMNPRPGGDEMTQQLMTGARLAFSLDLSHSVTMVQILYLNVTYIMNGRKDTPGGEVGWPFLRAGMAVAEAIGMHRDPDQWDLDPEAATERRIVFWEIHGYDVLQSIALGRGQCIADYAIDCAFPDDRDETGFHCKTYALTRIWSRINERQVRISPSPYSEVCNIDDALNDFERNLPPHLSPSTSPSLLDLADPARKRLSFRRNMLLMYLTEARMALHRGGFVRSLRDHPLEPISGPQSRSFICCLEACRTLIGLVRNVLAIHDQQIHRRWHFFFHLFSACACLAACAIRAPSSSLAHAVLSELEHGLDLFRIAQRDEVTQLMRLRDHAVEAVRAGHSGNQTEDLELVGAHKTLRRAQSDSTNHPPPILPPESTNDQVLPGPVDNSHQFSFDDASEPLPPGPGEFDMNTVSPSLCSFDRGLLTRQFLMELGLWS